MKYIHALIFVVIAACYANSLQASHPILYNVVKSEKIQLAHKSVVFNKTPSISYDEDAQKCRSYRGVAIAGGVIFVAGIGAAAGGIIIAQNAIANGMPGAAIGGGFLAAVGIGMSIAGIPLTIVVAVKASRYCGDARRRSMYISPSTKGLGLACRF